MRHTAFKTIRNWHGRAKTFNMANPSGSDKKMYGVRRTHAGGDEETSAFSDINGVSLYYKIRGSGPHPVICLPGALGTAQTDFQPQLDYFGREGSGFKIVSFDPRGYGASRPADRFGTNFFVGDAKDANALMKFLSLPNFSVLGWSDGGISALHLAAMFPGNVRKLALWGANAYITEDDIACYEKTRDISNWSAKMRDPLLKIYGRSLQDLMSQWTDTIIKLFSKDGGDLCMGELCKIRCPTLIVHGAKDPMVPSFHPHYLHKHVAGSRLKIMEEGKHNLHLRYSEEFNKLIEEFLDE